MRGRFHHKLGLLSILAACGTWGTAWLMPFSSSANDVVSDTEIAQTALFSASSSVMSELTLWVGIMLIGKDFVRRYRQKLNPDYWWQKISSRRG